MDQQKVDMYIMSNQKYFPAEKIMYLKEKLLAADEEKMSMISTIELKDHNDSFGFNFLGELGNRQVYAWRYRDGSFETFDLWLLWCFNHNRLV